jgi:hypothetical protein
MEDIVFNLLGLCLHFVNHLPQTSIKVKVQIKILLTSEMHKEFDVILVNHVEAPFTSKISLNHS